MIRLSEHGFHRTREMNVGVDELVAAIDNPTLSYPSPPEYGPGRRVSVHGRLAVIHTDHPNPTIITVLWNGACGRHDPPAAA